MLIKPVFYRQHDKGERLSPIHTGDAHVQGDAVVAASFFKCRYT